MVQKDMKAATLTVFLPGSRVLSESEVAALPEEKKAATAAEPAGVWVEVQCPEDACSADRNRITIPAKGVSPEETKGIWLSLFCPDDQCMFEQSTDVP